MNKKILFYVQIFIALFGIFYFVSCGLLGTTIPVKSYYQISYIPQPIDIPGSQKPYPFSLEVGRFTVQRIYNNEKIVYRFNPEQLQYYEYEHWAVRPEFMITDIVMKHLDATKLCNRISTEFLDIKPDYRIEGSVDAIEKYDATDIFYAHLAMSFKMVRAIDGQQVWDYSFDQRKQVFQKKMSYTVITLRSIMEAQMDSVVKQLDAYFLSLEKGTPQDTKQQLKLQAVPALPDTVSGTTEKGYEIIPEKNIRKK